MGPEIAPIHNHVVVFGERHLRYVLVLLMNYYNDARTHLSLKDAPVPCAAEIAGRIICRPILGGLHHLAGDLRLERTCTYIQDAVAQFVFKYSIPDISLAICSSEFHSSTVP